MIEQNTNIMQIAPVDVSEARQAMQDTSLMLDESSLVVVVDQKSYEDAGKLLIKIKAKAQELDSRRKLITRPLDQAKKAVMDLFRDPIDLLAKAELNLKRTILTYTQEQEKKRQEAERKAQEAARKEEAAQRKRLEARADKAEANGDTEKAEYLRERAEEINVPRPIVAPQVNRVAGISERKVWKYRITDVTAIPREYMIPNEKAIGALARQTNGSIVIPGVEFYTEQTIAAGAC